MTPLIPAGPFRTLAMPEGGSFPYYVIPFDSDGVCEGVQTRAHLLAHLTDATDIFVFSHGWNNDWTTATNRYEGFIEGFQKLRTKFALPLPDPYRPLLIGIFWPSQAMEWFSGEAAPDFAGGEEGAMYSGLRDIASALPVAKRNRFHELAQAASLDETEAAEFADLLASTLRQTSDVEAGESVTLSGEDLLSAARALQEPEPDYDAIGAASSTLSSDMPAAANSLGDLLGRLDPRNLIKPFTVWQMKDRAGRVGKNGVAPLLADLLNGTRSARVHLLGHSFGCKVVMTAASVMPEPPRQLESALLLQAAVSQYAFSPTVPERGVAGGFVKALARIRQPILATFSRYDLALTETFHLALRREDDLGELQFAAAGTPSQFAALGGFGPQASNADIVFIKDPLESYDLPHAKPLVGVNGSARISGHGDISQEATWWAEYCLLMAHQS